MLGADSFNTWLVTYAIRENKISSPDIELKITLASTTVYEVPLMAGNAPMGTLSSANLATLQQEGIPLVAISTFVVHSGALEHNGVNFIITRADSAINSPEDLRGKTVSVANFASSATASFIALLKMEYGIDAKMKEDIVDASNEVTLVQTGGNLAEAIRRGHIDIALIGQQNEGPRASKDPDFKVVMNLDDIFYSIYGTPTVTSALVVNRDFQQNNPEAVEAAYELLKRSLAYGDEHLDELAAKFAAEREDREHADFYKMIYNGHSGISLGEIEGEVKDSIMAVFGFSLMAGRLDALPDPDVVFGSPYVR